MKNDFKAILALIATYTVGNFLLLLNRGIYWDGWYHMPLILAKSPVLDYLANGQRLYTLYYFFRFVEWAGHPIFFIKLFSFTGWLLAGIFLYAILRKKLNLRIDRAFFIAASFNLIPIYLVRVESAMVPYSIDNMFFFLAAFLYFIAETTDGKISAGTLFLTSWALFFLSFFTPSFLVFYGGFLALLFFFHYRKNPEQPLRDIAWTWFKNNFFFIILPVIFWSLKTVFWQPNGAFAYYNQFISLKDISAPFITTLLWENIIFGFFWPIIAPLTILDRKIFAGLFLIIGMITYLIAKKILASDDGRSADAEESAIEAKQYLGAGAALFILGFLPYVMVGKSPHLFGDGFAMRHALLLPLGSSLILLGMILLMIKKEWQSRTQIVILALFTVFTAYNYYGLDMDHYKQLAIIESLKETQNTDIRTASSLILYDKVGVNWQNRNVAGEEYSGYVQSAFPKEQLKVAVSEGNDPVLAYTTAAVPLAQFFPPGFDPGRKIVRVSLNSAATQEISTVAHWLTLKKSELFGTEEELDKKIKDIFAIRLLTKES